MLSQVEIKQISKEDFSKAMDILDNELGGKRVRNKDFQDKKFKQFPQFFIGAFLDNELIGIVCGFPRDDYLLLSEIAVDKRFQKRGFGKRLVKKFEKIGKENRYNKINSGARDEVIGFYDSLGYKPFLLIQYKKGEYLLEDFSEFYILKQGVVEKYVTLNVKVEKANLSSLSKYRKKYPKAHFQYIFTKKLKR